MTNEKCGVYRILNLINNKVYIGSSLDCIRRLYQHKTALRKGTHCNQHLQSAYNKYGENSFTFELIEEYDEETIVSMEHWWYNMTNASNEDYGYNIRSPLPEYTQDRKGGSEKQKIRQYSLDGQYLKTYESVKLAAAVTNIPYYRLTSITNKKTSHGKSSGFIWLLEKDIEREKELLALATKGHKRITCENIDTGEKQNFSSAKEAAKTMNVSREKIYATLHNELLLENKYKLYYTANKSEWRKKRRPRRIIQLTKSGEQIKVFKQLKDVVEEFNLTRNEVANITKGWQNRRYPHLYFKFESLTPTIPVPR